VLGHGSKVTRHRLCGYEGLPRSQFATRARPDQSFAPGSALRLAVVADVDAWQGTDVDQLAGHRHELQRDVALITKV